MFLITQSDQGRNEDLKILCCMFEGRFPFNFQKSGLYRSTLLCDTDTVSTQICYIFLFLQINLSSSVRLLSTENSSRQPSQTKVIAADDSQRFVGSIINPQGFSKDGKFL